LKFLFARVVVIVTGLLPACSSSRVEKISVTPKPTNVSRPSASPAPGDAPLTFEVLRADTPRTTAKERSFVAPKDWKIAVRGAATLLELPEAGSRMALVDVDAKDADAAVAAAWAAYGGQTRKLKMSSDRANREGWNDTRFYFYETSPNEQREVIASARRSSGESWTVLIEDVSVAVIDKRNAQRALIHSSLLPRVRT
jgi:hypothetical protein